MTWDAAARRKTLDFGLLGQGTGATQGLTRTFDYQADGNMTSLVQGGRNYTYAYNDNGLIQNRHSDFRDLTIAPRDARGRITEQSLYLFGAATLFPLRESLFWNNDSTLKSYTVQRAGGAAPYNETRNYDYNARLQLTSESFVPAAGQPSKSFGFEFDGNTAGGLGVLTKAQTNNGATGEFKKEIALVDAWMRSTAEGSGSKAVQIQGTVKGASKVEVKVNADPVPVVNYDGPNSSGDWNVTVPVLPGSTNNTITATATHPTGKASATTTSKFNVAGTFSGTKLNYDQAGNVIERIYSNKTQVLTWDATGRLIKVTERNTANTGYDWSAIYDPLGRRIQVKYTPVTANVAGTVITSKSYFDPLVEFLEIGVEIAGQRYWKVMGPDLIGVYGAMNGIGGLESVIRESNGTISGVVTDYFGNVVASTTTTSVTWNPITTTGYGPVPNSNPTRLETLAAAPSLPSVVQSFAWRTRKVDITGFINMGARYYDYASTRFLSPDPAGFGSDMTLYSYANGDPINHVDADGRLTYGFVKGFFMGSWASSSDKDQQFGIMLGAMVSKMIPGYNFFAIARDTLHAVYEVYQASNDMSQNGINGQNVYRAIMAAYSIYGGVTGMIKGFDAVFARGGVIDRLGTSLTNASGDVDREISNDMINKKVDQFKVSVGLKSHVDETQRTTSMAAKFQGLTGRDYKFVQIVRGTALIGPDRDWSLDVFNSLENEVYDVAELPPYYPQQWSLSGSAVMFDRPGITNSFGFVRVNIWQEFETGVVDTSNNEIVGSFRWGAGFNRNGEIIYQYGAGDNIELSPVSNEFTEIYFKNKR